MSINMLANLIRMKIENSLSFLTKASHMMSTGMNILSLSRHVRQHWPYVTITSMVTKLDNSVPLSPLSSSPATGSAPIYRDYRSEMIRYLNDYHIEFQYEEPSYFNLKACPSCHGPSSSEVSDSHKRKGNDNFGRHYLKIHIYKGEYKCFHCGSKGKWDSFMTLWQASKQDESKQSKSHDVDVSPSFPVSLSHPATKIEIPSSSLASMKEDK